MPGHAMQNNKGPVTHLMFCIELSHIAICSCINLSKFVCTYCCLSFFLKLVAFPLISEASCFSFLATADTLPRSYVLCYNVSDYWVCQVYFPFWQQKARWQNSFVSIHFSLKTYHKKISFLLPNEQFNTVIRKLCQNICSSKELHLGTLLFFFP